MKKKTNKALAVSLCAAMLAAGTAFGTLAWLTDTTDSVENVFTYGHVGLTLTEEGAEVPEQGGNLLKNYHIVPGMTAAKDPVVSVEAGSEDCIVFVEVEESENWASSGISYEIATGWTPLPDVDGVYYREVTTADDSIEDIPLHVLKDNQVTVSGELTQKQIQELADSKVSLGFKAYAVQLEKGSEKFTAKDAWAVAKPVSTVE